jgi:competence ComEA-like helix-hairpin-helix protein
MLDVAFIDENFQPQRININTATENELDFHPYINQTVAKAIVAYRFQHGKFTSAEEIRKLHNLKHDIADKIIPYLSIE